MKNIIQIDDYPHTLFPFKADDYISKIVLSSLYEPLFYEKNDEFFSYYIEDEIINENTVKFKLKEFYWSNGMKLKAEDIYNTLFYILRNKYLFVNYLDCIIGVEEYLYENGKEENIGITLENNSIIIQFKYSIDYKNLFSTIQFTPIYLINGIPDIKISNGKYKLDEFESNYIKIKINEFFKSNKNNQLKEINFKVVKNVFQGIEEFFRNKETLMTCSTHFPYKLISKYIEINEFNMKKSNIYFFLEMKDYLLPIKTNLNIHMKNALKKDTFLSNGLCITDSYYFDSYLIKNEKNNKKINFNTIIKNFKINPIKILFSNYYPNEEIVKYIEKFFISNNIKVKIIKANDLKDFMEEYRSSNYDIALTLMNPLNCEEINLLLYYMKSISYNIDVHEKYINLLNEYLETNDKSKINEYLLEYSTNIPLATGKHIYLKREDFNFNIDKNDLFKF